MPLNFVPFGTGLIFSSPPRVAWLAVTRRRWATTFNNNTHRLDQASIHQSTMAMLRASIENPPAPIEQEHGRLLPPIGGQGPPGFSSCHSGSSCLLLVSSGSSSCADLLGQDEQDRRDDRKHSWILILLLLFSDHQALATEHQSLKPPPHSPRPKLRLQLSKDSIR